MGKHDGGVAVEVTNPKLQPTLSPGQITQFQLLYEDLINIIFLWSVFPPPPPVRHVLL
jgi:hypothetical protein